MLSWGNFRARLPEHVRSLEKVAHRSTCTVALVVVHEIADRRCALRR
jgi:predicted GIY-YIG superfamily endonuclease